jgi:hypothetical protein
MKREEEKIRKLFQQLSEEDERQMPSFAQNWNAALSRQEKPKAQWRGWRVAVAAALLLVLGAGFAGWWIYVRQSTEQVVEIISSDRPVDGFTPPPPVFPSQAPVKNPHSVTRRQRRFVRPQPTASLISQWRSPTESLLQIPGEQLLKKVPRWDESFVNIKATSPNQIN